MGLLSLAGALCYAELGSRFPEAGGGYVFLREAYGARCAFVYGWMALLVMDPGLTAALGVGLARYLLAAVGGSAAWVPALAVGAILAVAGASLLGIRSSARVLRWTAAAKLAAIAVLVVAALLQGDGAAATEAVGRAGGTVPPFAMLAGALMGAFFAFGGWWDLGKMGEEIIDPRRTLPVALVGGIVAVTAVYAGLSTAFVHLLHRQAPSTDEAFVAALGATLFGAGGAKLLAVVVVIAVAGSLAAVLLGAPRVYLAMARGGVFPAALVRFDTQRQSAARATLVQVVLACLLVMVGTFEQILGYFIPVVVFFLGLSAAAMLFLPRPRPDEEAFRCPGHPVPLVLFLVLVVAMVVLFAVGQPLQTAIGAGVTALGIPVAWAVVRPLAPNPYPLGSVRF
jgi:APA family basic amino acid/polyamine antiporter